VYGFVVAAVDTMHSYSSSHVEGCSFSELRGIVTDAYRRYWDWPRHDFNMYNQWMGCRFNDLSDWPIDAAIIFDDDRHVLLLGSVKSACEITEVNRRLGVNIDIVVTMNDDDTRIHGEPDCYETYYAELGVENLRYGGFDKTNVKGEEYDAKKNEYVRRWVAMCSDMDAAFLDGEEAVSPVRDKVTVLFHCYGGVNRSGSALCAFLILRKEHTARQAIERLVDARPGNDYWKKRGYFIDGLIEIGWRNRTRCGLADMRHVGGVHHITSSSSSSAASQRSSAPRPWSPLDIDSDSEMHGMSSGARRCYRTGSSPPLSLQVLAEDDEHSEGDMGCLASETRPSRHWLPAEPAKAEVCCWGDVMSPSSPSHPLPRPAVLDEESDEGVLSC